MQINELIGDKLLNRLDKGFVTHHDEVILSQKNVVKVNGKLNHRANS